MSNNPKFLHATCISHKGKGILITGKSGSGKSDLALRMIMNKGAKLVSDDITNTSIIQNPKSKIQNLISSPPENIKGLLEVRGVGIIKLPFVKKVKTSLIIELVEQVERMPEAEYAEIEGIKIRKLKLFPFECSSLDKILAFLKLED